MIFLSYRRDDDDTSFQATALTRELIGRYGEGAVFTDYNGLVPGEPWPDRLRSELSVRPVVLAVVGQNWNPARLHAPGDWVREEVCAGIRERKVIVLLLGKAKLPPPTELPQNCELAQLHTLQNLQLRPRGDYARDFEELCRWLERRCPGLGLPDMFGACYDALCVILCTEADCTHSLRAAFFPHHARVLRVLPVQGGPFTTIDQTLRVLNRCDTESAGCPWPLLRFLEAVKERAGEPDRRAELTQLQFRWLESRYPASEFGERLASLALALGTQADHPRPDIEDDFRACTLGGCSSGLPESLMAPRAYAAVLAGRQHGGEPGESVPSPLLHFAHRLRDRFPECRSALEQWEDDATRSLADYYGVCTTIINTEQFSPVTQTAQARPPVAPEVDAWLTVLVRPTRPGGRDYAVRGWLFHPGAPAGVALLGGASPIVREAGLPACLRELRGGAIEVRKGIDFQVELVVPPSLRNLPFGEWPVSDQPGRAGTFGQEHTVVVRCLRRIADRVVLGRLRRHWDHVRRGPDELPLAENLSPGARGVFRVPADLPAEELRARLADCPGVVGVVFARPAAECRRAIDAAIEAGVPLVAWCRPGCHEDPTPLIRSAEPAALTQDLLARRPAGASAGSGFVVLLDDPGRLPPDLDPAHRLRPPNGCHE